MKVLHYIPSIAQDQGGVAAYLSILSEELGKRCELVIATCVQNGNLPMRNCKVADLTGFTFTDAGLKPSWNGIHRFLKLCDSILDAERPDIVHINGIWTIDRWLMQRQAIKRNIPTYVMPHGMLEPWILRRHYWTKKFPALMLYEKKALRSAKCLIATAESEKQNLLKLKMNNADIPVIANGIDVKDIPLKDSWDIRKKILYVSRIHIKKGIEMLLDVAGSIKDSLHDYEIIIAGEGDHDYVSGLRDKAINAGVNVKFIGGVYGTKKWNVFQNADFFVLPTNSENFGYVIAEALACGTPVITTKGTPWAEINNVSGYWIERNGNELRKAMLMMLGKTADELKEMGKNGRKLIEENYSAAKMAELLMAVYEQ